MRAIVKERGERIDRIARAMVGTERGGATEAVFAANPGLARQTVLSLDGNLPAGTAVAPPANFSPPVPAGIVLAWE